MKTVVLIVFTLAIGAAGFWYITENNRKDRAEALRRQQEQAEKTERLQRERFQAQKEEDERTRKERAELLAKDEAVRMFFSYLNREEDRLKEEAETYKIKLQKVDLDAQSLSDELRAIERANAARVANSKTRKEAQRDKIERVSALLKSDTLNRLAQDYCGEDLSALHSAFEAEVQKVKDVDDQYQKRYAANLKKYDETVKDIDKIVNRKTKVAREKYELVKKQTKENDSIRLPQLKSQLAAIMRDIARIDGKKMKSNWDRKKRDELQDRMILLQNQIAQFEDVSGLASANLAHMEVTEAESEARRKGDLANKILDHDNTIVINERIHEQAIFNLGKDYEEKSLGRIRDKMKDRRQMYEYYLVQAERNLKYIRGSSKNIDFLNKDEIEELRRKIASKVSESIMDEEDGK